MKVLGFVLIMVGGYLIGMAMARSWEMMLKEVKNIRSGLSILAAQIEYTHSPLHKALQAVGKDLSGEAGIFFSSWASWIEKTKKPSLALLRVRESFPHSSAFPPEIWPMLEQLASTLGVFPVPDQINQLKMVQVRMERLEVSIQQQVPRKVRLWRYCGFLAGLALALIFV